MTGVEIAWLIQRIWDWKKCALLGIEGIYFSSNSESIAFESPFISKTFEDKYKFEYTVEQFVIGQKCLSSSPTQASENFLRAYIH